MDAGFAARRRCPGRRWSNRRPARARPRRRSRVSVSAELGLAEHRRLVDLPVAGVEDVAERRLDQQAVALGDRVGERDIGDPERVEVDRAAALDDVQLDLAGQPLLLQLAGDQAGGERRRVERHLQVGGEIGQRADMVLMPVGQDDADQVLRPLLDEFEVGQDRGRCPDSRGRRRSGRRSAISHLPRQP